MDPIQQYHSLLDSNDFVFLVCKCATETTYIVMIPILGGFTDSTADFRGHWCPFCMSYLRQLQSLAKDIKAKNGQIIAVTAENEAELAQTRKASGFACKVIVDPTHLLATELRNNALLDVALTTKSGYEHDMAQPAILVAKGPKKEDILFRWEIVPSMVSHCPQHLWSPEYRSLWLLLSIPGSLTLSCT